MVSLVHFFLLLEQNLNALHENHSVIESSAVALPVFDISRSPFILSDKNLEGLPALSLSTDTANYMDMANIIFRYPLLDFLIAPPSMPAIGSRTTDVSLTLLSPYRWSPGSLVGGLGKQ